MSDVLLAETDVVVAERDEAAAGTTDPGCGVVGTVHETVLKEERGAVGD